jgi:hypothetical protein
MRGWGTRQSFSLSFGLDAGKPYDELHKIYAQIVVAVKMLIGTYRQRTQGSLPKNHREWEATIGWRPLENDQIPGRLDVLIDAIEKICRPAIQEAAK